MNRRSQDHRSGDGPSADRLHGAGPAKARARPRSLRTDQASRETQADEVARSLRPQRSESAGPTSPTALRRRVEQWSDADLSEVRIDRALSHHDHNVLGATDGQSIQLHRGLDDTLSGAWHDHVLLHEFVHAAQVQETLEQEPSRAPGREPLQLFACSCSPSPGPAKAPASPLDALRRGGPITPAEATSILTLYEGASTSTRDSVIAEFHTAGAASTSVRRLLDALPSTTLQAKRELVDDLLRRVQRASMRAASGQTIAQMGVTQGTWRQQQAEADARRVAAAAAAARGLPPPATVSPAEVSAAETAAVEAGSIQPTVVNAWRLLTPAQQSAWNVRAANAITAIVAACGTKVPELGVTAANIDFDPDQVQQYGDGIFALSGNPITVGMGFIEAAEYDPEYVIGTVVHEVTGHDEYGTGVEWEVHQASLATFPTSASADVQDDLYNYIGTELQAVLREYQYYKPPTAAHTTAGVQDQDPTWIVEERLGVLRDNYEPSIAWALLLGMWDRFRADPRITAGALTMLRGAIGREMPAVTLPN